MARASALTWLRDRLDQLRSPRYAAALAAFALVVTWLVEPWWVPAAVVLVGLALVVRWASASPRQRTVAIAAVAAWAVAVVAWAAADQVALAGHRIGLEIVLLCAVAATGSLLGWLVGRILEAADGQVLRSPYPVAILFVLGAAARAFALNTIVDQFDVELFDLVLRHDIANVVWAIGATIVVLNVLYAEMTRRAFRWTPELKKTAALLAVAFTLAAQVGFTLIHVAGTTVVGRSDVVVGAHVDDVDNVPDGFDSAHVEVKWSTVQPGPDRWNWSYYDDQFEQVQESGLDVLLLAGMAPPHWLVQRHRNATMVDQDGDVFHWLDEAPGTPRERIHDLSYVDPEVNDARDEFLRRVVDRYAARDAVAAVAVMNEPAYPPDFNPFRIGSYDNATVDAFRDFLRDRYPNVSAMNASLGTDFATFDEVEPPSGLDGSYGRVWQSFREASLVDHVERAIGVARNRTDKPVTVKIMAHYLTRFAQPQTALTGSVVERLVEMSDVVALDLYPLSRSDLRQTLDYYERLAGEKPIWVAEFNYALGANLPTMGARMYTTLAMLGERTERVYLFTAETHYLYGLDRYASSPGQTAVQLYDTPPWSLSFAEEVGQLAVHEVTSIVNLYLVYATASAFFGFPVAPWLTLLVLVVPLPATPKLTKAQEIGGRVAVAAGIWLVVWLARAAGL